MRKIYRLFASFVTSALLFSCTSATVAPQSGPLPADDNQSVDNVSLRTKSVSPFGETVVVLGSSIAQGVGATPLDRSWVGLLRTHFGTSKKVVNLAVPGYTSYHILPSQTGSTRRDRPAVDTLHNISKALSFKPYTLILSVTTNDVARNYDLDEYFKNIDAVIAEAKKGNVKRIFVTTSTPRGDLAVARRQILLQQATQIVRKYGNYGVDYWEDLTDDNLSIRKIYDSGDQIHPNNGGHEKLFNRMRVKLETLK